MLDREAATDMLATGVKLDDAAVVRSALVAGASPLDVITVYLPTRSHTQIDTGAWFAAAFLGATRALAAMSHWGADVNGTAHSELTALHYATLHAHEEAVMFLLAAGADPRALDKNGRAPIDLISRTSRQPRRGRNRAIRLALTSAGG